MHSRPHPREARSTAGQAGAKSQILFGAVVGLPSAAALQSLTGAAWGTQTLGYLYFCSCAIRDAAASGRPALPPLGYTLVAQTIFQ